MEGGSAIPEHFFIVACSLGVGYETLVSHSFFSLKLISDAAYRRLVKIGLPVIRRQMLGEQSPDRLLVIDAHHTLPTADTEVGTTVLLPDGATAENQNLTFVSETPRGRLFKAVTPGITRVFRRWRVGRTDSDHEGPISRPISLPALHQGGWRRW